MYGGWPARRVRSVAMDILKIAAATPLLLLTASQNMSEVEVAIEGLRDQPSYVLDTVRSNARAYFEVEPSRNRCMRCRYIDRNGRCPSRRSSRRSPGSGC